MRALLLLWALLCLPCASLARPGPLVVILLPGTSLRDWRSADAPCLHRLMATGALAVMNTRTARLPNDRKRESEESASLTLGAGSRAASVTEADVFVAPAMPASGLNATAGEIYARRMGLPAPPDTDVNPAWPALLKANRGRGYDIRLGNLADALTAAGVPIRAAGGAQSFLLAASGRGTVLRASSLQACPNGCVIWDAGGDPHTADDLLEQAAATVTVSGRLIVLSPCATDADYAKGRRLCPVLEWGPDVPAGVLRSPSTRRSGLVTDTDFVPTVAAYFGVTNLPAAPFGSPWQAYPVPQPEHQVMALEAQAYRQARGVQLLPYLAGFLALWIGSGTALAAAGRLPVFWPLVPPALLLAVLAGTSLATAAVLCPFCVLTVALVWRFTGALRTLLVVLTVTATILVLDMVAGGWLMRQSLLGYSAVEGARYYGIGNEAMGVLLAPMLVLSARLWTPARRSRVSLVLALGVTAALLGSPLAGAKAGGLLVSLASFGTLLFPLFGGRWTPRVVALLALAVVLTMAAVAAADAFLPGATHSHVGEAVRRASAGGVSEWGDIVWRKLMVEGRLATRSAWALALWVGLAGWLTLRRISRAVTRQEAALRVAGCVAIAACLLLNDAGVVAAALCVVILWSDEACRAGQKKPPEAVLLPGAVVSPNDY